jgi:hypothetical protein
VNPLRWSCIAAFSAAFFASHLAAAQPKPAASSGDAGAAVATKQAKAYITAGNQHYFAGRWEDAYAEYAIAWRLSPDWQSAAGLGRSAYRTRHYAIAIMALTLYLREAPKGRIQRREAAEVEKWIETSKENVGYFLITAPPGVEILVDGFSAGKAPLLAPVPVDAGKHEVEAHGASPERLTTTILVGRTREITFREVHSTPPSSGPSPRTLALLGGVALTVGGAAVGGAFVGVAIERGNDRQRAALDVEGRDSMRGFAAAEAEAKNIAFWGFVGAGLCAAGTTAFYITTRSPGAAPVSAAIGVRGGGPAVWIQGHF